MLFFGLFVLVILPLFLFYCVDVLKKSENFKGNPATGFIIAILYIFAGMAIMADIIIIARLLKLL